ncbi:MAG: glycosyltransferase family 39 protein [Myxococcales bacterium]
MKRPAELTGPRISLMIRRVLLFVFPVGALLAVFLISGFRGVDLGPHWDEGRWQIDPARQMVESGIFLPRHYYYPSVGQWLVVLPAWPSLLKSAFLTGGSPTAMQAAMKASVDAPTYLFTVRKVFMVFSALAIIWNYSAVLALGRKHWEAAVAAAAMGLSWEYAYHARWVANDCILAQFAALMVFMLAMFHRRRRPVWLYLAAAAVGLATGSKQQGVFLMLPVLLAAVLLRPANPPGGRLGRAVTACVVAFAVFMVTTPGIVLDLFAFLRDTKDLSRIYGGSHGGFSVATTWQHWRVVLIYLGVAYFSPSHIVGMAISASALLGAVMWVRKDRRFAIILLSFPLLFLIFFCAKYRVAIARNYLVLAPFICLLAARGLGEVMNRLPARWGKWSLGSALAAVAILQAIWLIRAGESVRHVDQKAYVRQAIAYVADHPKTRFRISDRIRAVVNELKLVVPANVTSAPDFQSVVLFLKGDMGYPEHLITNDPWLTQATFGPHEVNTEYYSVWGGHDRVAVMTRAKARQSRLPCAN